MVPIPDINSVRDQLSAIAERAREFEDHYGDELAAVHPAYRESARNLVHYLALRAEDIRELQEQLGARSRSFLELGHIMLVAALVQAIVLAGVMIVLPLAPQAGQLGSCRHKSLIFSYFLLIGFGFMLLEMCFLQKLILYLAHPIYSAAAVIAAFLVFAGLGSMVSSRLRRGGRAIAVAAGGIVVVGLAYMFGLDDVVLTKVD